jgi:hypothetical protein
MAATHVFPSFRPDGSLHLAHQLASGRAAALFAVLAGVGLALASGGQSPATGRRLWAARAGVVARAGLLIGLGLALGEVDSPPLVILAYYGLLFVLAVPVLGLRSPVLAAAAVVAAVATPVLSQVARSSTSPRPVSEPGGSDLLTELFLTGTYPALTWTTYLLAGLAIGRLDLRRRAVQLQLLAGGAVAAVIARWLSGWLLDLAGGAGELQQSVPQVLGNQPVDRLLDGGLFGVTPTGDWRWLLVAAPHSGTTLDLVATTGSAAAVLGACLMLAALAAAQGLGSVGSRRQHDADPLLRACPLARPVDRAQGRRPHGTGGGCWSPGRS